MSKNAILCLLTTSDILSVSRTREQRHNKVPPTVVAEAGDHRLELWTTGRLEAALEAGYEIWVVSTRTAPQPHDDWWRQHVPGNRTIFHATDLWDRWHDRIEAWLKEQGYELETFTENNRTSLPYMVWAYVNGLPWPRGGNSTFPAFWLEALDTLEKDGHVIRRATRPAREDHPSRSGVPSP